MADIELVIKIPEEDYKHILHRQKECCITTSELEDVIANGTLLPKGHGRLKDVDKFPVNEIERIEYNYECGENECHSEEIVYLDDIIRAETIIEADKESEGTNVSSS